MKCLIVLASVVLIAVAPSGVMTCQLSSATEAAARELIDVMVREGGSEAAMELAEMGGEAAVRQVLDRAMDEGGEELVERVTQYGTCYGPSALKAVEQSPLEMVQSLDGVSPDLVEPAIRAAARDPEGMVRLVAAYGKDALALEAKHPGVGAQLAQKLGVDGIAIGQKLTTDQAVTLTRYADDIAALPKGERSQLLDVMAKAPTRILDYLETHPKVLLTAGGVATVVAVKDNVFGGTGPSANGKSPPAGWIERFIFGVANRFVHPVMIVVAILVGGVFCYVAIQLRSVWKLNAARLRRVERRRSRS
jgi:hypothetical protein